MKSTAEQFQPGDVLYGRMRPYLNKVFLAEFHGLCSGEFIPFRKTPEVDGKYLLYFLNSWEFVSYASHLTEGDRPRVDFSQIAGYPFPLPPLAKQHQIVELIETHFTRLDAAEAALARVQANLRRYRAAVLKAACEGRLVPTEAELACAEGRTYEPAATLLARILAARRTQWQAAYPGKKYKEPAGPDGDNLPEMPEGWCWATVEQVGEVQLGRQRAPQHHTGLHMRPYLRVANVYEDRIDTSDVLSMNFTPAEYKTFQLKSGDILLNEGQSPEFLGRPAIYRDEVPGACFQNTLIRFRACSGILPAYALTVFRHYMHSGRFQKLSQITTNIAHLSVGRFVRVEFPIPPLVEQERVVSEVERCLSLAAQIEKSVQVNSRRHHALRQAILYRAFSGQLSATDNASEFAQMQFDLR
jgi:type I restriction enzyme S subunit